MMERRAGGIRPPLPRSGSYRRVWIHWRRDGAGGILLLAGGKLVHLNRVAAAVWEEIDRVGDRVTLHRRMRRLYRGVHDATLRAEIDSLLDHWLDEDWITRVENPLFPTPEDGWEGLGSTSS